MSEKKLINNGTCRAGRSVALSLCWDGFVLRDSPGSTVGGYVEVKFGTVVLNK